MADCSVVILAAGEGTRMKSNYPKVMHKAAGIPMIERVVTAAERAVGKKAILVYGSGGNTLPDHFGDRCLYALQAERKGSGHAAMMAADAIKQSGAAYVIIIAGDMPLIREGSIRRLAEAAEASEFGGMLLTGRLDDPTGYGRIVRDKNGDVECIVEQTDATEEQKLIKEVNISFYCFRTEPFLKALTMLKPSNKKNEYYITDCISIIRGFGLRFGAIETEDMSECEGVNDKLQLAAASKILYRRKCEALMRDGVEIIDPDNTYIHDDAVIGRDTIIYPGTIIEENTVIGEGCTIYPCVIRNSTIPDGATVTDRAVTDAEMQLHGRRKICI